MPNLDLQGKNFPIKDPSIKGYFGNNDSASYEYMKKVKSELDNKGTKDSDDEKVLKWIDNNLDKQIKAIDTQKRIIMNTDGQGDKKGGNAFKDTHKKDNDNADPTRVRMPKIKGGSREIMSNKVTYESIEAEIEAARYLIEYMNNNKKNI